MNNVYLGLGSNIEDRISYLNEALAAIESLPECTLQNVSSFYESKPYGKTDQSKFINAAARLLTNLDPYSLYEELKKIESSLGRIRRVRWGPREIDIDILLFDEIVLEKKELTIPHADMTNRSFVLIPLLELNSELAHPKTKKLLKEYLDTIKENDILKISNNNFKP